MSMENEIWADCSVCKYFRLDNGEQACDLFDVIGLPDRRREGTNKKCCSSFNSFQNVTKPDFSQMNLGVLYFYNTINPDKVYEDVDL